MTGNETEVDKATLIKLMKRRIKTLGRWIRVDARGHEFARCLDHEGQQRALNAMILLLEGGLDPKDFESAEE